MTSINKKSKFETFSKTFTRFKKIGKIFKYFTVLSV